MAALAYFQPATWRKWRALACGLYVYPVASAGKTNTSICHVLFSSRRLRTAESAPSSNTQMFVSMDDDAMPTGAAILGCSPLGMAVGPSWPYLRLSLFHSCFGSAFGLPMSALVSTLQIMGCLVLPDVYVDEGRSAGMPVRWPSTCSINQTCHARLVLADGWPAHLCTTMLRLLDDDPCAHGRMGDALQRLRHGVLHAPCLPSHSWRCTLLAMPLTAWLHSASGEGPACAQTELRPLCHLALPTGGV